MASEPLEDLFVRLRGDPKEYNEMWDKAAKAAEQGMDSAKQAGDAAEKLAGDAAKHTTTWLETVTEKTKNLFGILDKAATESIKDLTGALATVAGSSASVVAGFTKDVAKAMEEEGKETDKLKDKTKETEKETDKFGGTMKALGSTLKTVLHGAEELVQKGLGPLHTLLKSLTGGKLLSEVFSDALIKGSKDEITSFAEQVQPSFNALLGLTKKAVSETTTAAKELAQEKLPEWYESAKESALEFYKANQGVVISIGAVAAALGAAYSTFRIVSGAVSILTGALSLLGIQQVATLALWATLKTVGLAVSTTIFTIRLALSAATIAFNLFGGAVGLIVGSLTFITTLIPIVGILATVGAGLYAAGMSIKEAAGVLSTVRFNSEQFRGVTSIFQEWWEIIKLIVRAAKVDMGLAWEALVLGGKLAIEQIKQYWPPFWNYLKSAFGEVWNVIVTTFEEKFNQAIMRISGVLTYLPFTSGLETSIRNATNSSNAAIRGTVALAEANLSRLNRNFSLPNMTPTAAMQEYRERLEEIIEQVMALEDKSKKAGEQVGAAFVEGFRKELAMIDAVAIRSAEALARVREYYDRLRKPQVILPWEGSKDGKKTDINPYNPVGPAPAADRTAQNTSMMVGLLNGVLNVLKNIADKGGIVFDIADLPKI